MADRNIIIEDDKGNRYFPYTKVELVEGAETPSGAQAKADTAESNAKSYAKSYTDQQVATKADIGHKHSAEDIVSGTLSIARLPVASIASRGIVQLTTLRTSTSTDLALAARAMSNHLNSGDHDERYYTKAEVDALVSTGGMMVPGDETIVTVTPSSGSEWQVEAEYWEGVVSFMVGRPGRYRVSGYVRSGGGVDSGRVAVCIPGWSGDSLTADAGTVYFDDEPPPGLGWASNIFQTSNQSSAVAFTLDMLVPAAAGGTIIVAAYGSYVGEVSLKGAEGKSPITLAWSKRS